MTPAPHTTMMVGAAAAVCTTISFVPQLVRVWRSKSARDISLGMFLIFSLGVLLWLIYGVLLHSLPMIAANTATLALALAILVLKLRYDHWSGCGPKQALRPLEDAQTGRHEKE